MPIFPEGTILTFTLTGGTPVVANVAVNDIKYEPDAIRFQRMEFSVARQQEVKNADGSKMITYLTAGAVPRQYLPGCSPNETVRPLGTDDANLDNIYKRFDVKRYEIVGAMSIDTEIDKLMSIAESHNAILSWFEDFQNKGRSYDISFPVLKNMQLVNLNALTNTGLMMSGNALGAANPETDLLITKFQPVVEQEDPNDANATTSEVLRSFTMTIEKRTLVASSSETW